MKRIAVAKLNQKSCLQTLRRTSHSSHQVLLIEIPIHGSKNRLIRFLTNSARIMIIHSTLMRMLTIHTVWQTLKSLSSTNPLKILHWKSRVELLKGIQKKLMIIVTRSLGRFRPMRRQLLDLNSSPRESFVI